jgi:outer membrane protein with beta-barrel domain
MRRVVAVLALSVVAGLASNASAGGLDLRAGAFFPRTESNLFIDDSVLYTVEKSDWIGFYGGAEYSFGLSDKVELGFHVDGYSRSPNTFYRDFVRPSGREITQTLKFETIPLGMTIRFVPRTGRGEVSPYIGVGPDVVFWQYEEFGDFIDFDDPTHPVIPDHFLSDGAAFGFHVAAGVRVPISYDFAIVGEVRYLWAKDDMGEDFRGNRIDLSGPTATIGVNIRF